VIHRFFQNGIHTIFEQKHSFFETFFEILIINAVFGMEYIDLQ
jgi:hypothetical protein